jgi:predicted DNA-binding ribbon-helix-helix protein
MSERRLPKHSVVLKGHATSISLEPEFWNAIKKIASGDNVALATLLATLDDARAKINPQPSLASAVRVYVLKRAQQAR